MNNARREKLSDWLDRLAKLRDDLESLQDEEMESFDNIPALQSPPRSVAILEFRESIDTIDDALETMDTLARNLEQHITKF